MSTTVADPATTTAAPVPSSYPSPTVLVGGSKGIPTGLSLPPSGLKEDFLHPGDYSNGLHPGEQNL